MTYRKLPYMMCDCNIFREEQEGVKFNNLVVAHSLNIHCKHGGVVVSQTA